MRIIRRIRVDQCGRGVWNTWVVRKAFEDVFAERELPGDKGWKQIFSEWGWLVSWDGYLKRGFQEKEVKMS